MITQEIPRNPNPKTKIKCVKCSKEYEFSTESIKEEPLPYPNNTVVEGLLVCPHCGLRTHSYYMPERVRFDLEKLRGAIEEYQTLRTAKSFSRYRQLHESYKHNFDNAQKRYKEMLQPEAENGQSANQ